MDRTTRYQGAIIYDGHILLIKQRGNGGYEWWNIPGGGREANETEEQCVIREMKEETNLTVQIECLLIDGPSHRHSPYQRFKTYLCTPTGGSIRADGAESIDLRWFDINDDSQMNLEVLNNETAYVMLERIRKALSDKQRE